MFFFFQNVKCGGTHWTYSEVQSTAGIFLKRCQLIAFAYELLNKWQNSKHYIHDPSIPGTLGWRVKSLWHITTWIYQHKIIRPSSWETLSSLDQKTLVSLMLFYLKKDLIRTAVKSWLLSVLCSTVMQKAWRERNPQARIRAAYQAIEMNREWVEFNLTSSVKLWLIQSDFRAGMVYIIKSNKNAWTRDAQDVGTILVIPLWFYRIGQYWIFNAHFLCHLSLIII